MYYSNAVRPVVADFPRYVCLTISRNHKIFLLYPFKQSATKVPLVELAGWWPLTYHPSSPALLLCYINTYTGWHTDVCPYHVLVNRFMFVSHPHHVRHSRQDQIRPCWLFWESQNNWHRQMSVSNPYCLCVMSALHLCCPCHICITSMSYLSTNSHVDMVRMWHGHHTDIIRM